MDIGGVRLAPAAAAQSVANRAEPTGSATRAVSTELPKDQVVRSAGQADAVKVDVRQDRAREQQARERLLQEFIQNRAVLDPRTREVVYQAVNSRTGEIVRQFPDEAILKLRDYANQMMGFNERGALGLKRTV
jgi:uncharacterized FlaG/YvyC family protein